MRKLAFWIVLLTVSFFAMLSCRHGMNHAGMDMGEPIPVIEGQFSAPLIIPSEVGTTATITAQSVTATINGFGNVSGLGYAQNSLLGPTIRAIAGSDVNVTLSNQLNESTNVHWHGLKIPFDMDGHPENVVNPGNTFEYAFTLNQRAGMYWYHPHPHMLTGKQVFQGLAGLFIVNDDEEAALNLPSGNRELPLVIQDKRVEAGQIPFNPTMGEQMTGMMGQFVLVNGVYAPYHHVETAKYRVRILNGSNARVYNLALSNNASFTLIGSDGGLLSQSVSVNRLLIGPGERADVIIDFSQMTLHSEVFLVSKTFNGDYSQGSQEFSIMKFIVNAQVEDTFTIPSLLSSITPLTENMASKTRNFDIQNARHSMSGNMMMHTINDKVFSMNRIDELIQHGAIEVWTFDNSKGKEPHPMHLHGVQFQILSRTGGRGALTPLDRGWKDMALCMPGEKVKIIIPFNAHKGKYLYHCHNLEHEDTGMMGQFMVE